MARERFSFDDTIEFDKDELKTNNDIHANHTGKFTFDDEVKEKKVAKPKKKKRKRRENEIDKARRQATEEVEATAFDRLGVLPGAVCGGGHLCPVQSGQV